MLCSSGEIDNILFYNFWYSEVVRIGIWSVLQSLAVIHEPGLSGGLPNSRHVLVARRQKCRDCLDVPYTRIAFISLDRIVISSSLKCNLARPAT